MNVSVDYIQTHLDAPLHLADLSQQFHISPYHLQRTFKRIKGVTPRQFVESCRLGDFKARLQEGETVTDALYNAGYQSSSSLYERAPVQLGMTPTAYRKGGKGMRIGYSIVESPLGFVLVAATERGVTAVRFGDSEETIEADFIREYPKAELTRDDELLRPWVNLLLLSLQGQPSTQQVISRCTCHNLSVESLASPKSDSCRTNTFLSRDSARLLGNPLLHELLLKHVLPIQLRCLSHATV